MFYDNRDRGSMSSSNIRNDSIMQNHFVNKRENYLYNTYENYSINSIQFSLNISNLALQNASLCPLMIKTRIILFIYYNIYIIYSIL
jgi:uncharacterized protein YjaZ